MFDIVIIIRNLHFLFLLRHPHDVLHFERFYDVDVDRFFLSILHFHHINKSRLQMTKQKNDLDDDKVNFISVYLVKENQEKKIKL